MATTIYGACNDAFLHRNGILPGETPLFVHRCGVSGVHPGELFYDKPRQRGDLPLLFQARHAKHRGQPRVFYSFLLPGLS